MDIVKSLFPISLRANNPKDLLISILIYVVANLVGGWILGFLSAIPLIGFVFGFIGWVFGIYCAIGVIVAVLIFLKVIK